jgi:hypothetical protein
MLARLEFSVALDVPVLVVVVVLLVTAVVMVGS